MFALKFPHGPRGVVWDQQAWQPVDINMQLAAWLDMSTASGWYLYNDEPPYGAQLSRGGHAKGIIVWSETSRTLVWLLHSVPRWPCSLTLDPIPAAASTYGHSFYCLTTIYTPALVRAIHHQLEIMHAHVYDCRDVQPVVHADRLLVSLHRLVLGNVTHVAKAPSLHIDVFDAVTTDPVIAQSWRALSPRGCSALGPTERVRDTDHVQCGSVVWHTSQDQSKWSTSGTTVFVSDLNRTASQLHRGGGGFVIGDRGLARALRNCL